MTKTPILDSSGNKVVVNEGESAFITATFYDTSGDVLSKAAITTLVCTLRDAGGDIINSRDEQNILDANGGTVASNGTLTLKLGPDDNTVAGAVIETHSVLLTWTWTDDDAATQTGVHEWTLDVSPSSTLRRVEVSVAQPIGEDGTTVTIVRGDDYSSDDGRAITWVGAGVDQWPDLTSATIRMTAVRRGKVLNFTPVVTSATGTQTLQLELTGDDTTVPSGRYQYDMQATLNGSNREITLLRGVMNVEVSHVTANE